MPERRILLITTGGTIASKPLSQGWEPQLSGEQIQDFVPELAEIADFETMALMNIDSTNMNPACWSTMAEVIRASYEDYDGFVLTHGTDTMAYTAAALSYMIQNSPKPIVLTGSQKSIALRDTDARRNLRDAFVYAVDPGANGVKVVFDSRILLGTRVRKTHTMSYNAFDSIDFPAIGLVRDRTVVYFVRETPNEALSFRMSLDPNVAVLKLVPGLRPEILTEVASLADAVVIEGFGVGGLPNLAGWNLAEVAGELLAAGKILVMTTQVAHEGSDMGVYQVGHDLKHRLGMLEAYTMTLEALTCKLMWILARTKDPQEVKELLYHVVDHDII